MHKYNSLFFSSLLFLGACTSSDTPKGVIEKQKMINVLTDLHIIDGSLYATVQIPDTLYKYGMGKYNLLFKRYHIDSAQFRKSFKYYTSDPVTFKSMYDKVTDNLQHKIDSINGINNPKRNAVPSK